MKHHTSPVRTITCVHQGYELYGSDRVFVQSVRSLREHFPAARIQVLLPARGTLAAEIERLGAKVEVHDLWILRRKGILKRATIGLPALVKAIARARRQISESDLTYVSTCVIVDFLCAARLSRRPMLVHVHELPQGMVLRVLRMLLAWSSARVLFISKATQAAFALGPGQGLGFVWNSCPSPASPTPPGYDGTRPLRILMIGRINRWKGQPLLIQAIADIVRQGRRVEVRIAGGTFRSPELRAALLKTIEDHDLAGTVLVEDFRADPSPLYRWSDVVAVPSLAPEPFGLVAIEAMAHARPVIAAAHGGLVEIVEPGRTGWLFAPRDRSALAAAILEAVDTPHLVRERGHAACQSHAARFTEERYAGRFKAFVDEALGAAHGAAGVVPEPAASSPPR